MTEPLIQFEDVHKNFGDQSVLRGVNLSIYPSQITTIIGKSGEGKSVLLKHIIGLIQQDSGQIYVEGKAISAMTKAEKKALKKRFSYMFQGTALFDALTAFENIALPLVEKTRLPTAEIADRVHEKMKQLDISQIDDKYPSQMSGGMKKRVALARALITDPEVVLFDEPTTGLDPIRKNMVHSLIADHQEKLGFTAVLVSHEIPDIFFISQRLAMLDNGRIIFQGDPEELKQNPDPSIRTFVQGLEPRHDALTGMVSQAYSQERVHQELDRLRRYATPVSLLVLRVENLGVIYEKLGLKTGQTALRNLAQTVRTSLRITDICSRTALNKMTIILPNTNLTQAREVCGKLSRIVVGPDIPLSIREKGVCLDIRAGIAEAAPDSRLETMVAEAESGLGTYFEFRVC